MVDETVSEMMRRLGGWLRRPELDKPGVEVWELPDGQLHAHPARGQGPLVLEVLKRIVL